MKHSHNRRFFSLLIGLVMIFLLSVGMVAAFAENASEDAETSGAVKATRTYTLQNAMDSVVTELYVYPSSGTEKGENLAGDGLVRGEQVKVTVTGYMLHTENETLFTV